MTLLGHLIVSNSRDTSRRIKYLVDSCREECRIQFVVEPERRLSALHRAAWAHSEVRLFNGKELSTEDFDMSLNRDTFHTLLEIFDTPEQRNMKNLISGRTALHLALEAHNWRVVHELVQIGVDREIMDDANETPLSMAQRLLEEAARRGQSAPQLELCRDLLSQV